jgi:hypothetical protein
LYSKEQSNTTNSLTKETSMSSIATKIFPTFFLYI